VKPHTVITITAGAFAKMTPAQLESLQQNVLREGVWDTIDAEADVHISGGDYLGVQLPYIFLGIEKDGYCHS
jgi:hypothetical protein